MEQNDIFKDKFNNYLARIKSYQNQFNDISEESTKTTLIMPFFALLGYDVFDSNEFTPEFICDVAAKKGEKVDYAIMKDGEPIILIEAKRAGMKLQKQQQGQLYRYFSTNRCRVAILTNGVTYQFFSDLNAANVMDDDPFLSFNLLEDDPSIYLSAVKQFCKETFDVKNVISRAVYQKYAKVVEKTIKQDLISPSDEIVKYFLLRPEIKTGNRITAQMIEKYRDVTRRAMRKVFGITIENVEKNEQCNSQCSNMEEEHKANTPDTIAEQIKNIISSIPDISCTPEGNSEFIRLHLYTADSRKLGTVKISKSDMSIQYKKIGQDAYIIKTADELKKYIM